jgi:Tol biopolymer transport system component
MTSPITPEAAVYDIKSLNSAVVSPDGTSIVYVVGHTDRETGRNAGNIWRCDIDGGNQRQLTHAGDSNGNPAWSPDGKSLAYVAKREGDHPGAIVVLPLAGGESRIVTRHASGPSGIQWSPDGSSIAYVVEVDPVNLEETPKDKNAAPPVIVVDRLDYKLDGRGVFNTKRRQIHIVDVESGDRRRLGDLSVHYGHPMWSPDGKTISANVRPASSSSMSNPARCGRHRHRAATPAAGGCRTDRGFSSSATRRLPRPRIITLWTRPQASPAR